MAAMTAASSPRRRHVLVVLGRIREALRRSGGCNPSPDDPREIAVVPDRGEAPGHRPTRVSLAVSTRRVFSYAPFAALVCAALVVVTPDGAHAVPPPAPTQVVPPTPWWSWAARVLAPTTVRAAPNLGAKSLGVLQPTTPHADGPTTLLVLETRLVGKTEWARLLLAQRPNGSSGWVRSDVLRFRLNPMRIIIDQSDRRTNVLRNGRQVLSVRNAVGTPATPTPTGRFAVAEEIRVPSGFLGPMVLVTSGFSEVLNEYAGGNGRFAMHGTSLPGLIGTRASHGCIRHLNADILRIASLVSPGTPIIIRK